MPKSTLKSGTDSPVKVGKRNVEFKEVIKEKYDPLVGICFFLLYKILSGAIFMYQKKYKQSRLYYMWKAEYDLAKKYCASLLSSVPDPFSFNSKKDNWVFCDISGGITFYDTLNDLKNDAVTGEDYYREKFDERMKVYKEILNRKEESDSENPSSEHPYPQM